MGTDRETKRIAQRAALKLNPSLNLWVWCWTADGSFRWFMSYPELYEYHLVRSDLLAVSKDEPTWVPLKNPDMSPHAHR